MIRRFAIEPLESRRLLAVTGSLSGFAYLDTHDFGVKDADEAGFAGLTVQLQSVDGQGNLSSVSGVGPTQTASDGSYNFSGLAAGTYQIQISPSSKLAEGTLSPGSAGGTAGTNEIQVALAAGQSGTDYNFAILGAATNEISLRMFMASTGSLTQFLTTLHAKPSVEPGTSGSSTFAASYSTGGPGVAIVSSSATIAATDSPTLTSMTVTIQDPQDGSSEQLSAVTTGTTLTSSYANGVLTVSGVASVATYQTVLQSVQYRITSSPAHVGDRTVSIVVNDGTDSSTAVTSTVAVVQGTGPSGYTIAADKGLISASAAVSTGFTFSNALVDTTYNYSVNSSGGGTAVTGSGTVTATTQDVTGINVSALPNGTLTYSVTLTDTSGQTGSAATATATLDTVAPTGYSITANQSQINSSAATAAGFTFSGAEVGATYNYSITSSGGGTAVTSSGTVSSATQSITGINISSLTDGTVTFSVTLTDTAGNVGSAATATATLDRVAPSGYSITPNKSPLGASSSLSTGFTLAGGETGTTYQYSISSSGSGGTALTGSGSVTATTQSITGVNVNSLPDGTLTYSVTLTDAAGNTGTAATATATLDKTAPSGYTITAVPAAVNATTATTAGLKFTAAEVGTTYNYTISSSGASVTGSGNVTSATQQISGVNVSSLTDGNLLYSVTLTDAAGNVGAAATATGMLDRVAPSGYTISANQLVNIAASTNTSFTFAAAELNTTYNYTVTSSVGTASVSGSGSVTSATQQVTGVNVSSLADGTLTFSVTLTDPAGNVGNPVTATATLNRQVPTGYTISADRTLINANQATSTGFTFANAMTATGTTYNFTVASSGGPGSVTNSGSVTSATQDITGINVASLPDGVLTYSVKLTNAVGNPGAAATATATLDKTAPNNYTIAAVPAALNATAAANAGFKFTGAEVDATYNYSISGSGRSPITGSGNVTTATQTVSGINVSSFSDGTLTYSVTLTDVAGNVGVAATATSVLDRVAPSGYTIEANQALVNIPNSTNTGFTFTAAEVNATYNYTVTSSVGSASVTGSGSVTSATQQVAGVNVSTLSDGTLTFSVTLTDEAGNVGNLATATATLNTQAPTGYTIAADRTLINANQAASTGFTFINATTTTGTTFNFTVTSSKGGSPVIGSGNVTSATQDITGINVAALPDGVLTYSVKLTNAIGNPGAAATATATLDKTAPNGYTIAAVPAALNATAAISAGFKFTDAELGATYNYSISGSGGSPITGSGNVSTTTQSVSGINVSSFSDGTLTYSVTLTDAAGNVGVAATATSVLDRVAPSGYLIAANQALVNIPNSTNTGFTFTAAEVNATYNYTVTSSVGSASVTGSGSVTSATQQVAGVNVSTLSDGTLTFSVTLTDEAGNVGNLATATATLDTQAPTGYTIAADRTLINANQAVSTGFTFINAATTTGTTFNFTVASSKGGSPITGSGNVTSATQDIGGINVATLPDGVLTYSVKLTNAIGNPGAAATATATLDKTPPGGYKITANQAFVNLAGRTNTGFTFTTAEVNATYNFTVTSSIGTASATGSGSVTSATEQITGVNVSSLSDGTLTYKVTLTDAAGNVGLPATATAILDTKAPSGYTVSANQAVINLAASTNAGFTFAQAEVDTTYQYSITSTGGGAVTGSGNVTSATQQVTGINVSSLGDGRLTYSVTLTDPAGNVGLASTATAALAKAAPTGYAISPDSSTFNALTSSGAGFSFSNAEIGTTYNYTITSNNGGTPVTGSGTVTSATQEVNGITLNGSDTTTKLSDGTVTFSVKLTDAAGHVGAAATATAGLNRVLPPAFTVTPDQSTYTAANDANAGFTISPAEVNDAYSFYFVLSGLPTIVRGNGTITSATMHVTGVDMSVLPSGKYTLHVILTDAVGNATSENATVTLNNPIPKFTVTPDQSTINAAAVNSTGFTFAAATLGTTYDYTVSGSGGSPVTGTGSVTSATQDITGINLSSLADGTVTFSVTLTSAEGTSTPITATATIDRTLPTAIALSTSVAPAGQPIGSLVGLLQTVGPQSTAGSYTYALVSGNGGTDNGSFQISGDELQTDVANLSSGGPSYSIRVRSTDSQGKFIEQEFLITVSSTDPVTPTVAISNTSIVHGQPVGTSVGTLSTTGSMVASQINYTLVSGTVGDNNSSFQIVNGQLETKSVLAAGTYTVRVRSSGTFLISDVVDLSGVNGPYAFQVPYDPTQLSSSSFQLAAADAGLISLSSDATGSWYPASSQNKEAAGSLAEPNYLGSYSSFWNSVTAANPSATLNNVVGSSGIDTVAKTVWAVVDQPGEYAVGVQVFTEKVFTITIT